MCLWLFHAEAVLIFSLAAVCDTVILKIDKRFCT